MIFPTRGDCRATERGALQVEGVLKAATFRTGREVGKCRESCPLQAYEEKRRRKDEQREAEEAAAEQAAIKKEEARQVCMSFWSGILCR